MNTNQDPWLFPDRSILIFLGSLLAILLMANLMYIFWVDEIDRLDGISEMIVEQFDFNRESTFSAWFSSALLLINSLVAYQLARALWARNVAVARRCLLIAVGFFVLSIDDIAQFHEELEEEMLYPLEDAFRIDRFNDFVGALFPLLLAAGLLILVAGPYLRFIEPRNRFLVALCVWFVVMAGLAEMLYEAAGCWTDQCERLEYLVEEGCELGALYGFVIFQTRELVRALRPA